MEALGAHLYIFKIFLRAFIAVLKAPRDVVHNQIFNVGKNEENYRIKQVAEIAKQTVPNSQIQYVEGAEATCVLISRIDKIAMFVV